MKVIDNIVEVCEPVLHQNEKDTPMNVTIPEECDDMNKLMGEEASVLTINGICHLPYKNILKEKFKVYNSDKTMCTQKSICGTRTTQLSR